MRVASLSELVISEACRGDIPDWLFAKLVLEVLSVFQRFHLAAQKGGPRVDPDLMYHNQHPDVIRHIRNMQLFPHQQQQPPPPPPVAPATVVHHQPNAAPGGAQNLQPMTYQQQGQLLQQLLAERQGRMTPAGAPTPGPAAAGSSSSLPQLPYDPNLSFNLGSMSSLNSFPPISSSPARNREMTTSTAVITEVSMGSNNIPTSSSSLQ